MNAPQVHYFTVEWAKSGAEELLVSVGAPGKNIQVYNTFNQKLEIHTLQNLR